MLGQLPSLMSIYIEIYTHPRYEQQEQQEQEQEKHGAVSQIGSSPPYCATFKEVMTMVLAICVMLYSLALRKRPH